MRLNEWQNTRNLSFIPPDGNFVLSNYVIGPEQQISLPVNVRPSISFSDEGYGRLDIEVTTGSTGGKMVEDFAIIIPMPKAVNQANLTPTVGTYSFDQVTKTIKWEIKKLPNTTVSSLTGSVSAHAKPCLLNPPPLGRQAVLTAHVHHVSTTGPLPTHPHPAPSSASKAWRTDGKLLTPDAAAPRSHVNRFR